jgi:UDP:flavonoid glycosyltransferase YjiC (YdhE family)
VTTPHIAFFVDPSHGHIHPILGIIAELARRGSYVTCPVSEYFAQRIADSGGHPLIYSPSDYRSWFLPAALKCKDDPAAVGILWKKYEEEELANAAPQFETLYRTKRPDLIIYDLRSLAGQALANNWHIQKVEHSPQLIHTGGLNMFGRTYDEHMIIVSIPRQFQPHTDELDGRFHFVGPVYRNRYLSNTWRPGTSNQQTILVGATTAFPQPDFFAAVTKALKGCAYEVVLSLGEDNSPELLADLPPNFRINRCSSHLDILRYASLFICQGGSGSALEAFYNGVPVLAIPPSNVHREFSDRIKELGLGIQLGGLSPISAITEAVCSLMTDVGIRRRVKEMQKTLNESNPAKLAGDLIFGRL